MALYINDESRRSITNREKLLILSIVLRIVICFQSSLVLAHDSPIFDLNDIFSKQMTRSRLLMPNLSENNWNKIHRIADRPIASAAIRCKIMRFAENNEISYVEGQFICRKYIKDHGFRNNEFNSFIHSFLQRSVQIYQIVITLFTAII